MIIPKPWRRHCRLFRRRVNCMSVNALVTRVDISKTNIPHADHEWIRRHRSRYIPHLLHITLQASKKNTHMIHFIHHRVVRILVNRRVRAGLALALAVSCVWRAACIGRDFCAGGAEGCRVVLHFFEEVGFGFEIVWWGRKWE